MKIRVDIRPMTNTLHHEWDGETGKTFINFLKRKENKQRMINKLEQIIKPENITNIDFDLKDRTCRIELNSFLTFQDVHQITNDLTINDLIAYKI